MRTTEFDSSSDDEEEVEEGQLAPLHISWLPLSIVECSQYLGICALPGCKFKDVRRSLQRDVGELKNQGVQDLFVFCTRGELSRYRVPSLLEVYEQHGFTVHHAPFPDGDVPELEQCCQILAELQVCLERNRRTVLHRRLLAAPALVDHDRPRSHRDPPRAPRRRSHPNGEAIQLSSRVSGEVQRVQGEKRGFDRAIGVPVIRSLNRGSFAFACN
uniref:protein-tyrosine-phosphatase n=1 Tax=Fundulus heteroclitus TaxID=8078 RepID=A0A3Q2Q876_FUNHE